MAGPGGGCACGSVRYQVEGPLRQVIACHCEQCRRSSGHFVAATATRRKYFHLHDSADLRWYEAVPGFRRGFCSVCGSSLFFEQIGEDRMSIAAGSLDDAVGLGIAAHIFVDEAGAYYDVDDSVENSADRHCSVALPA